MKLSDEYTLKLETFVGVLEDIVDGCLPDGVDKNGGLCFLMASLGLYESLTPTMSRVRPIHKINRFITEWDHFSGDSTYPIPVPPEAKLHGIDTPCELFYVRSPWVGQQGALRRHLCAYLIERIEEELL